MVSWRGSSLRMRPSRSAYRSFWFFCAVAIWFASTSSWPRTRAISCIVCSCWFRISMVAVLSDFGVEARVEVAGQRVDLGAQVEDGAARFIVVEQAGARVQGQPGGKGEGDGRKAGRGRFDHCLTLPKQYGAGCSLHCIPPRCQYG
jgi:hypothetical protein